MRGNQCTARPQKCIQNDIATPCDVQYRIFQHFNRLYRWVHFDVILVSAKRIYARILPNICAIATVLAQMDIIDVRLLAIFEDKAEFMLTAIQTAHATR